MKLSPEPACAYSVSGNCKLCPAVTTNPEGGAAKPVTIVSSVVEFAGAKFASPSYCANKECGPATNEEVVSAAFPLPSKVLMPSETPLSKKFTLPVGDIFAALLKLLTVVIRLVGCRARGSCKGDSVAIVPAVPGANAVA